MAIPTYVASGALAEGSGSAFPALPTGWAADDIFLLACETNGETVAAPSGWTEITNSPQSNGGSSPTRLTLFWRRAVGGDTDPTVADPGNHLLARILAIRGCKTTGDPWSITSGGNGVTDAGGNATIVGATTTASDCLIVIFLATGVDSASATASGWTNADLGSLTERYDEGAIAGDGGALAAATGTKATAGAYANTTLTTWASSAYAGMTVALRSPGQTATLGTATETDTALALGTRLKRKLLGIAAETQTAVAVIVMLKPVNTGAPVISGTPVEGKTLLSTPGTWTGPPTSYGYQWQRADNAGFTVGVTSIGVNDASLVLSSSEVDRYVRVRVTATNASGSTIANSNVLGPVARKPNTAAPPPRLFVETEWELDPTAIVGTEKWRRVTHLVRSFHIRRGRNAALGRTETGTCRITFDNSDRRYEEGYAGSLLNYVNNPSLEDSGNGYSNLGGATEGHVPASGGNSAVGNAHWKIGRGVAAAVQNGDGVRIVNFDGTRIAVTPGTWTVSTYLRNEDYSNPSQGFRIDVLQYDSGGSLLSTTTVLTGTTIPNSVFWTRRGGSAGSSTPSQIVIGGSTATVAIQIFVTTNGAENNSGMSVDGVQLEPGTLLTAYIDGDADNGRWEGTEHQSRSYRGGPYYPNVRPMRRVRIIASYGNPVEDSSLETIPNAADDDPTLIAAWNKQGDVTRVTTNPLAGTYVYRGVDDGVTGATIATATRHQIPVMPGDQMLVSIYFRKPLGGAHPHSSATLNIYNREGVLVAQALTADIDPPDNAWQRYSSFTITVPPDGHFAWVVVNIVGASATTGTIGFADAAQVDFGALTDYQQGYGPRILFRGFMQRFPQSSASYKRGTVTVDAIDAMAVLAAGEFTGSPPSEGSKARLDRVLDHIGWPTALRKLDAGAIALVAGTDLKVAHLTHAQEVAETEEGVLFVDGPGYAVLHDKNHRATNPRSTVSQATFGDGAGELPYLPSILPDQDVQFVINEVKATRTGGIEQVATDATSIARYWTRSRSFATLHSTDGAALTFAQNVLAKLKEPALELDRLQVEPRRDERLWPVALGLEISDRVIVNRRPQSLELRTFPSFVEAIEHDVTIDDKTVQWTTGWSLSAV